MKQIAGFSLLEVLVAISIFAILGLTANQMLRTVITSHESSAQNTETLRSLSRAEHLLARDLQQLVPRGIRDEYGERLPPFVVNQGEFALELTRTGWSNPARVARSSLQRVAWLLNEDGELERRFWLVLDRAEDSEPITHVVMRDVDDFAVTLIDVEGGTTDVWPDESGVGGYFPAAVEVVISTEQLGDLRRVYVPPSLPAQIARQSGDSNGNGNRDADADADADTDAQVEEP